MGIVLVLTDSSSECTKALEALARFGDMLSTDVKVLLVLEDIYRLEKASISFGVPLPPDTVSSAKKRFSDRMKHLWRHIKGEEAELDLNVVAGDLKEEVVKYIEEEKPEMVIWGCQLTTNLCRTIDEVKVPSLIIK